MYLKDVNSILNGANVRTKPTPAVVHHSFAVYAWTQNRSALALTTSLLFFCLVFCLFVIVRNTIPKLKIAAPSGTHVVCHIIWLRLPLLPTTCYVRWAVHMTRISFMGFWYRYERIHSKLLIIPHNILKVKVLRTQLCIIMYKVHKICKKIRRRSSFWSLVPRRYRHL